MDFAGKLNDKVAAYNKLNQSISDAQKELLALAGELRLLQALAKEDKEEKESVEVPADE